VNKYIPKVGEKFEWRSDSCGIWQKAGACIAHSTKAVGYETPNGWITSVDKEFQFRPIPTKSDVEREQLIDILRKNYMLAEGKVEFIQEAGFTIPKKIKRSDVRRIIGINSSMKGYEDDALVEEIFNLLGDLVEQDEGGDV
jgi:hypothetical protein